MDRALLLVCLVWFSVYFFPFTLYTMLFFNNKGHSRSWYHQLVAYAKRCVGALEAADLHQFAYLLKRHEEFENVEKTKLTTDLSKVKQPSRTFRWKRRIWRPRNWVVTQFDDQTGNSVNVVPNRFSPELIADHRIGNPIDNENGSLRYFMSKSVKCETSNGVPFWRWVNFGCRYWTWLCNALFYTLIVIPWCSPLSVRALFSNEAFYADFEVDSSTGIIHPKTSSKTQSLMSRFNALWRHVNRSRNRFETTPDTGFLNKSVTRPLNWFWNHVVKGFCGSVLLLLVQPVMSIVVSFMSILAAGVAPAWVLLAVLGKQLFCILIWDLDAPKGSRKRKKVCLLGALVVVRFLLLGILQPVAAVVTALIVCPLCSLCVASAGAVRFGVRSAWDSAVFAVLIKPFAKIPSVDSFVARRIAGPGLSSAYFYQVRPEQALALLECRVELDELEQFHRQVLHMADRPKRLYLQRVKDLFGPFGVVVDLNSELYRALQKDVDLITVALNKQVSARRKHLRDQLTGTNLQKVRLTHRDLVWTVEASANILEKVYTERVLSRICDVAGPEGLKAFWRARNLREADWRGLAEQLLRDVFSPEFTTPLEEGEARFQLQVEHIDLKGYMSQLISAEHREDLDAVVATQAPPSKSRINTPLPDLTPQDFTPLIGGGSWVMGCFEGLADAKAVKIPSIPVIMALIYNRDVGIDDDRQEIPISDTRCRQLLISLSS